MGDPLTYRSKEEVEEVRQTRDPLDRFEQRAVDEFGLLDSDALREIDASVEGEVQEAVEFAEASEPPALAELTTDVYVQYGGSDDA